MRQAGEGSLSHSTPPLAAPSFFVFYLAAGCRDSFFRGRATARLFPFPKSGPSDLTRIQNESFFSFIRVAGFLFPFSFLRW